MHDITTQLEMAMRQQKLKYLKIKAYQQKEAGDP
jgi:hypothetical protein